MKNLKKIRNLQGFTLVELIVVITILAILGTFGFMSFSGYQSSARDGVRVSDIKNAETGLEVYVIKGGYYPTPDDFISYTGGTSEIKQGFLGDSVTRSVNMNKTPLDPKSNERYTYSTSGNGKYYQILATKENLSSSHLIPLVYADTTSVMVQGNYRMDPSLPSLLVVSGSVNTNSGIFDPNVCFIVDGGKNTLNNCVEKKYEMSLKDYDSSLVGYWDMETTSGTLLKDLSGNGNDGSMNGTSTTGGLLGRARYFNGTTDIIDLGSGSILNPIDEITIISVINHSSNQPQTARTCKQVFGRGGMWDNYASYQLNWCAGGTPSWGIQGSWDGFIRYGTGTYDRYEVMTNYSSQTNNIINHLVMKKNGTGFSVYINGIRILSKIWDFNTILDTNSITPKKIQASSTKVSIGGALTDTTDRYFNGIIDDIKIYNRALSDEEIRQQAKMAGF